MNEAEDFRKKHIKEEVEYDPKLADFPTLPFTMPRVIQDLLLMLDPQKYKPKFYSEA